MENYKLEISSSAEKTLKKIPKKDLPHIVKRISLLSVDPFPQGSRKLKGEHNVFRVRQGMYRIIYEVSQRKLIILILKIGNRKNIYYS